jgi:putative membrane protein
MAATFAFLHHIAAFTLFAAVVVQFISMREGLSLGSARRIATADMVLGASAGVLLVVGLARVFYFEKGAAYYFHNWAFVAKLSMFVIVALLSIIPTREFLSWRDAVRQGQVPVVTAERMRRVRTILHLELVGVVLIILFAALMARGIGIVA